MLQFHPLEKGVSFMKRMALFGLMMIIWIGMSACGSASTPTPTAEAAATEGSTTGTRVDILLEDNTIESSLASFQAGIPYSFVIANAGRHAHNFNISTPVSVAGSLDAALSSALLTVDQNQLSPGDSVTVDYTFPESAAGAPLEFSCLIQRHYDSGMLLAITVTK
jgi:uncharacterized cupredoxin-like copper-binding protein